MRYTSEKYVISCFSHVIHVFSTFGTNVEHVFHVRNMIVFHSPTVV